MGILGQLYPDDSAPAFALYKFSQSFTAAVGFFYSSVLTLPWQILIQGILVSRSSVLLILIFKLQVFCLVPLPIFLSSTNLSMLILRMKEFNCLLFCIAKFFY
jgi:hypothetical protein